MSSRSGRSACSYRENLKKKKKNWARKVSFPTAKKRKIIYRMSRGIFSLGSDLVLVRVLQRRNRIDMIIYLESKKNFNIYLFGYAET